MTRPFQRVRRLFAELRRRNVYRVAATYVVVAFVGFQAVKLLIPSTTLPAWADELILAFLIVGFPVSVVVAWAFQMTPEGVRRTPAAGGDGGVRSPVEAAERGSRLAVKALVGLGLVAGAVSGGWYLVGGGGEAGPPRPGDRSVAVLPFEALGQEEPGTFTEGMHDALLTRLSNVSGLQVISRTAVQQYRGTDKTTGVIAQELGVRWVLEGGVQQMGDQIQVNAQLIDPRTETHAWGESYRRDLTARDLFTLQSEITKKIARALEARLSTQERERVERRPTESLPAYRLYVQGRTHLDRRTETGMRQAADYFRRAVERDSSYALAWSGLADAWSLLANYGYAPGDTLYPRALEVARRALEIDPRLAEAHASLGLIHQDLRRDGPAALRELRRAAELKPSYARAHHWLGNHLEVLGRQEEGLLELERAAELDPMSPSIHVSLAIAYYGTGRIEEALEEARRTRELAPDYASGPLYTGIALSALGRHREAAEALRQVLERTAPSPLSAAGTRGWLAVVHARAGETGRARKLLAELERTEEFPFAEALARAGLGEWDAALRALRGVEYDYIRTTILRYDPVLDPLRDDPRFRKLVRRVNREWGLDPDGSLPESVDVSVASEAGE